MESVDLDKIQIGENSFVSKSTILSHLQTYNLYYEGQALQLRHREEEGELIIEGLLSVFWGLRQPIRLQMQDEETDRPRPSLTSLNGETENKEIYHASISIDVKAADDQSKDSSERHQLKPNDHPLAVRVLQGPCEQVSKIFLMEMDQVEEVTYDVAQYIKFELPVLRGFITKLQEEEEREIKRLKRRYADMREVIRRCMQSFSDGMMRPSSSLM